MSFTKGLAWTGFLVLADDNFYAEVSRLMTCTPCKMPILFTGQVRDEYQQTLGTRVA